ATPATARQPIVLQPDWVSRRWQHNSKNAAWTKPPFRVDTPSIHAANNDPKSWGSRSDAVKAVTAGKADGIGYVLTGSDIAAIDIDKCRNPATGATDDWAQALKYRRGD